MRRTSATSTASDRTAAPGRATGAIAIRTVQVADAGARDLAAWSEMAARVLEPNPFFEPEMLVPAAALYGGAELALIEKGGDLIGALPLRSCRRWRRVPGSCLAVWRHDDCYLGTPLLTPDAPKEALGALIDHARDRGRGLLAFEWIGTGGTVEAALRAAAAERGIAPLSYEAFDRAALVRRPEAGYLDQKLSKGRARELRRLRRQLSEHLGSPLEVHDRSGDADAIEGFLRAEADGWKGREGTAFATRPDYAAFFRDVCARFAAAGRLQLLVLSAGDTDVAWKVNFVVGDTIYCFKIAYSRELARFSPGVQLELDFVEIFHGTASHWSDSCAAPDNEMINRLWPDRRSLATLLVPTGGARGAASAQSARTVMAVRRRIRRTDDQAA